MSFNHQTRYHLIAMVIGIEDEGLPRFIHHKTLIGSADAHLFAVPVTLWNMAALRLRMHGADNYALIEENKTWAALVRKYCQNYGVTIEAINKIRQSVHEARVARRQA